LYKVGEVIYGCIVGLTVSWLMSKVWLVRPPVVEVKSMTVTKAGP